MNSSTLVACCTGRGRRRSASDNLTALLGVVPGRKINALALGHDERVLAEASIVVIQLVERDSR
jgi:hypothetical protein